MHNLKKKNIFFQKIPTRIKKYIWGRKDLWENWETHSNHFLIY